MTTMIFQVEKTERSLNHELIGISMKSEDRIVELRAEILHKQDQIVEEIKLIKSEVVGVKSEIRKLIYNYRK